MESAERTLSVLSGGGAGASVSVAGPFPGSFSVCRGSVLTGTSCQVDTCRIAGGVCRASDAAGVWRGRRGRPRHGSSRYRRALLSVAGRG
ncbi:hypothetical protein GCM10009642_21270 [Nocardiopsis metallicus]